MDYDTWLATNPAQEASDAEWEAFGLWAEGNLPDLDWDDDDAIQAAFDGPWRAYVDDIEAAAEAEIDAAREAEEMAREYDARDRYFDTGSDW